MATQISNQALLTFVSNGQSGSAASNIATTTLQGPLSAEKTALQPEYTQEKELTYLLTMRNTGAAPLTGLRVTDNLGTYLLQGSPVTPLTYTGPARLYENGQFLSEIPGETAVGSVSFPLPALASGSNALLVYTVKVNEKAPLASGSTITNTAVWTADSLAQPVTAFHVIPAADEAKVSIIKAMTPNPVSSGGRLTYQFTLYNHGNIPAENVVLTDLFDPAPSMLSVWVDQEPVSPGDFQYTGGSLTLPSPGSSYSITIPAATFTADPGTGVQMVTPGTVSVTVQGTI